LIKIEAGRFHFQTKFVLIRHTMNHFSAHRLLCSQCSLYGICGGKSHSGRGYF